MIAKALDKGFLFLASSFFRMFLGKVRGLEYLPKHTGYIVAANHDSYLDHPLIGLVLAKHLGHKAHFLAKKELFDTKLKKAFHDWAGAIPLDRKAGGKEALRWAVNALKQGKVIVIHPEGTRSIDGKLQRARTGVARLALQAQVPVVPLGMRGTFEILPKWRKIPSMRKADLIIGKPLTFPKYYAKKDESKALRTVTTAIMKSIARLTKERYEFD